jgi:hypothetical protein
MNRNDPISLEDQLRDRMNLNSEAIRAAARDGQIAEHEELLANLVKGLEFTYVQDRVYEEARNLRDTYEHMIPSEEWAEVYENDDGGWRDDDWDFLFPPRRGQQGHETLLMIYDSLAEFWEDLPPDTNKNSRPRKYNHTSARKIAKTRKRSSRWAPAFTWEWVERKTDKRASQSGPEIRKELVPLNSAAKLFVAVAKLYDRFYTVKNCRAIVDRAKNRRRSPEGLARLRERRRKAAEKFRKNARP